MELISRDKDMQAIEVRAGVSKRIPAQNPAELRVSEWTFAAGARSSPHTHGVPQINYVVKGKMRLKLEDEPETIVGPGDYYYTPAGCSHELEFIENTTMIIFNPPHD